MVTIIRNLRTAEFDACDVAKTGVEGVGLV